jgi:hypothetical protein
MDLIRSDLKKVVDVLQSIDLSLQILANAKTSKKTTAFVNRKVVAARLGVAPVVIDKLVYQGITSGGTSGLIEGVHYCKLDPTEANISNFLFDSIKVLEAAWTNFTNYEND